MNNNWIVQPQFNATHIQERLPSFNPQHVPEVAAGFWWSSESYVDLGSSTFKLIEGNGRTSYDLIQSTVAQQPSLLNENDNTQWRFADSGEVNPSRIATSGSLAAGWTGATYVAGWFRLPDANGDITGTNIPFGHRLNPSNRRLIAGTTSTNDRITWSLSGDGSAVSLTNFPTPFVGARFVWCEWFFDPQNVLGGTTDFDRSKFATNLSLQTRVADASVTPPSSLHDSISQMYLCSTSPTTSGADRIDWGGLLVYANGIPDLGNRRNLATYNAPTTIDF